MKVVIESTDVCSEFFEISPNMLQIGMHMLQLRFHVINQFVRLCHLFTCFLSTL